MRRTSKSSAFGGVIVIASIVVILAIIYGYFSNIYKLTQAGFDLKTSFRGTNQCKKLK